MIWTPDVLQILARADAGNGRAKVQEVCVACHGENGRFAVGPTFRISRASRAPRSTNSSMITGQAAERIR